MSRAKPGSRELSELKVMPDTIKICDIEFGLGCIEWYDAFQDDVTPAYLQSFRLENDDIPSLSINVNYGYLCEIGDWFVIVYGLLDRGAKIAMTAIPSSLVKSVVMYSPRSKVRKVVRHD